MRTVPVKKTFGLESIITFMGLSLIMTGTFFMYGFLQQTTFPKVEASATTAKPDKPMALGKPIALSIDKINTSLAIRQGGVNPATNQWILDEKNAFYISDSATPVFYGHNKKGVFDKLSKLQGEENLLIDTSDGRRLEYKFYESRQIAPSDASILAEKHVDTVILLTCSGAFYEFRQALYFTYVGER